MKRSYPESYRLVRQHEGGYVNHPKDPGGATKWGVTQRTYTAWRRQKGVPRADIRLIREAEAEEIYREQYWQAISGDALPIGIDYALFDFAVNSGVSRAVRTIQKIVGVTSDGVLGIVTLDKIQATAHHDARHSHEWLVVDLCRHRMAFLRGLRHWPTFGRGWSRRVVGNRPGVQGADKGVLDIAVMMVRGQTTEAERVSAGPGRGDGPRSLLSLLLSFLRKLLGSSPQLKKETP